MNTITCTSDDLLTVYIDRDDPTATVTYCYDDGEVQNTPFQTADMPMDDEIAAEWVNDWIETI